MMIYEVFVKEKLVDFAWLVVDNIDHTIKVLMGKKYDAEKRLRKEGLPYARHLTHIFQHFGVTFEGY